MKEKTSTVKVSKEEYVEFNDHGKVVFGKIRTTEIEGIKFTKGKGYCVDKSFGKWSVHETSIDYGKEGRLEMGNSWRVFTTKDEAKAIKVAKFLAKLVELD